MEKHTLTSDMQNYNTTYELVEQVLDTDIFYDEARKQQAERGDLSSFMYGERFGIGLNVLRTIASARWQNRQSLHGRAEYTNAPITERNILASPQHEELDDISYELASQRHRMQYLNNLERHIEKTKTGMEASYLRTHQHDVFDALENFLNDAGVSSNDPTVASTKAGYIKMPTGTGKTVVAVELVRALGSPKTLILTPRKDILHQIVGTEGRRGFSRFAPDTHVTTYYEDNKDLNGNVVVMTYASFNNQLAKGEIDKESFDLLICDEAHKALGPTVRKNVEAFSEGKITIGLTATDEYAENKKVDQILPERIYDLSLRESIDNGWLSPVQAWVYKTSVKIDQDARKEFSSAELRRLADVEGRNQKGVDFAKAFVEQGVHGIISCLPGENVQHAETIAEMLRKTEIVDPLTGEIRKIRAQALRGDMAEDIRQNIYSDFEDGLIDVLTFVDMLSEGWDSDRAKFLINLRPTCSPVFGVQRFGRILRPTGVGTPAQVIEFADDTQKAQFTVLHALGEYRYKAGKVYGPTESNETGTYKRIDLPAHLRKHIEGVHMRKISEIIAGRPYEADYSEELQIADIAAELNLCEAAILFIANENSMNIKNAQGGLGAPTTLISEINRDKIVAMIRHGRYDWLKGQTQDWVLQYIERREARLRESATISTPLTASQTENLQRVAAEEARDAALAETKATEKARIVRSKLIKKYEKTELDNLIKDVSAGKIAFDDFKQIIYSQAVTGNLQPMTIVRLSSCGKQPGEWGALQAKMIEGVMQYPALATSAINIAKQLGTITEVKNDIKPRGYEHHCYTMITLRDGETFAVDAAAKNSKVAQHVAAVHVIAKLAGIESKDINNPHARPKSALSNSPYEIIEDLDLPSDIISPKSKLIGLFQKRPNLKQPQFRNRGSVKKGDSFTFYATVVFQVGKDNYAVNGHGINEKSAQADAALRALVLHENDLKKVAAPDPYKVAKIDKQADVMNPTKFLAHRSAQLSLKLPVYDTIKTTEGTVSTVTITDNDGQLQTFQGHPVPHDEALDEHEMRTLRKESRDAACKLAIASIRLKYAQ